LLTIAASGCVISCAIDAVKAPMLVILDACASSDRALLRASSASRCYVTS
jgi:hypothetical protein